jgi:uncharacterized phiE125 gp8 family phage protein
MRMKWDGQRPLTPSLFSWDQVTQQLRLTDISESNYVTDLMDACTEYAEQALESSLLTRTITATFFAPPQASNLSYYPPQNNGMFLPRGPVQSITSVTDANGTVLASTTYILEREGHADLLIMLYGWKPPLTVVYTAGYGVNVTDVPSDIRMAIRTHVATLFDQRASTDERAILPVPHSLEAFYALRRRTSVVA